MTQNQVSVITNQVAITTDLGGSTNGDISLAYKTSSFYTLSSFLLLDLRHPCPTLNLVTSKGFK